MIDARREFLRKEKANADVDKQAKVKYQQESKSTRHWKLTKEQIKEFMNLSKDKQDEYLKNLEMC